MRILSVLSILFSLVIIAAYPANSQILLTIEKVVPSGLALKIMSYGTLDTTCHSIGLPKVSLIDPPHRGKVTVRLGFDYPSYSPQNKRFRCNSDRFPVVLIIYKSDPVYTGSDNFAIEVIDKFGTVERSRFNIDVR